MRAHAAPLLAIALLVGCRGASYAEPPRVERPAPSMATEAPLQLAAAGDVNLGRELGQAILSDPSYDPFSELGAAWRDADLRFVNLESQLSEQGGITQSAKHRLIFTGPPGGADLLARVGISVVSTANNHAWDYGKRALFETIANLERASVPFAGTGRDVTQAYRPVVLRSRGLSVALFAVTQIWNYGPFTEHEGRSYVAWANVEALRAGILDAKREHDFVLVSYHGGAEYLDVPVERTRAFVRSMMALGVDALLGHHPHVPQGIVWMNERPVLYSLGNFAFAGHRERPWTNYSFFARLELAKGRPPKLAACPIEIRGHRPRSLEPALSTRLLQHLQGLSGEAVHYGPANALGCWPVEPRAQLAVQQ